MLGSDGARRVVAVAAIGLVLCASAVAASTTHYTSGKRGKAPYISLTVSGGKVTTVYWLLVGSGASPSICNADPAHLNARINRNGSFNKTIYYYDGYTQIWGRLNGSRATVTVDDSASGESLGVCEHKHTFHAVDAALDQGRG